MKIAVPVADETRTIFTRVGRAPFFAIFEDGKFVELRVNHHAASHHDEEESHHVEEHSKDEVEHHRKDLHNLLDIDILLARAVGPNMKEALELSGIKVVKIRKKDGEMADEVIEKLLNKEIEQ
jgi:predicted Fe-Mo cluster-binding NifX family protein